MDLKNIMAKISRHQLIGMWQDMTLKELEKKESQCLWCCCAGSADPLVHSFIEKKANSAQVTHTAVSLCPAFWKAETWEAKSSSGVSSGFPRAFGSSLQYCVLQQHPEHVRMGWDGVQIHNLLYVAAQKHGEKWHF